ncbi:hypothetical protein GWL_15610 [Herbaspirillum sp. GW103]|nr:hypothetical protein GWL_15610 [Herbaspirillum sp. GW103]
MRNAAAAGAVGSGHGVPCLGLSVAGPGAGRPTGAQCGLSGANRRQKPAD